MKEITLDATVENIATLTEFVEAYLEEIGCPMKAMMQINVAVDELFGNIANYAYEGSVGKAKVTLDYDEQSHKFTMQFYDSGTEYNPLLNDDPDITLSAEERKIGGLGIFIVKKSMDSLAYDFIDGQNVLTIEKILF